MHVVSLLRQVDPTMARKILLVDDDQKTRVLLKAYLEKNQYEVILSHDGASFLAELRSHAEQLSLVILDVMPPDTDGFALCKIVRKQSNQREPELALAQAGGQHRLQRDERTLRQRLRGDRLHRHVGPVQADEETRAAHLANQRGLLAVVVQAQAHAADLDVASLFEPYVRLAHGRARNDGGMGLGLGIASGVIEGHGGELRLANHRAGGLNAVFRLPA